MRSSLRPFEFFNKMKKKPALQKILDNLENYSVEDLEKTKQPKWIRDVLVELKVRQEGSFVSVAEIAELMLKNSTPRKDNNSYSVYRYTGMTRYVETVEILENELILKVNNKDKFLLAGKEIDSRHITPAIHIQDIERYSDFAELKRKDDWQRLCAGEEQIIDYGGTNSGEKNYGLFTIRRLLNE